MPEYEIWKFWEKTYPRFHFKQTYGYSIYLLFSNLDCNHMQTKDLFLGEKEVDFCCWYFLQLSSYLHCEGVAHLFRFFW